MEKILKSLGMNAHQFATHYDIPYITVYQWVTGKRTPPSYVIKLLNEKIEREAKGEQLKIETEILNVIKIKRKNRINILAFVENDDFYLSNKSFYDKEITKNYSENNKIEVEYFKAVRI